jgi:integrase/recombinase XerD
VCWEKAARYTRGGSVSKVNITKRIKTESGWRFCTPAFAANGKLKPNVVLIDGEEQTHAEGRYYIDYLLDGQRKRLAAGATAAEAMSAAEKQTRTLAAHKAAAHAGMTLPKTPAAGSRQLREAVDIYLAEIEAHKKPKTHSAYRTALNYFLESCHKQTVEDITRTDLLAFVTFLRKGAAGRKGQSDRSVANKFESVMSFLKHQKITGLIGKNDRPGYVEEEVETYTQDELDKFFAACTQQERLWFEFFYRTAMREQEVMNADWSWVDFERSFITVKENKRTGFKPKAYKGRLISIPSSLLTLLKAWKEKSDSTCGLVFPTSGCKPKQNFLDECKAIAGLAGLNRDDFYLHKFRATRATRLLQGGMDLKSVQQMLGHSDLASTMRYLGAQRSEVLQAQIEQIDAQ